MPMPFPIPSRESLLVRNLWLKMFTKAFDVVPAPNFNQLGKPISQWQLGGNSGWQLDGGLNTNRLRVNLVEIGRMYRNVQDTSKVNPANLIDELYDEINGFDKNFAELNMRLSGVTRDSAGAALGLCNVHVFRTEDNSFIGETTSDANGVWSMPMLVGGPFFFVVYKSGAPDVAGISVNTIVASQA